MKVTKDKSRKFWVKFIVISTTLKLKKKIIHHFGMFMIFSWVLRVDETGKIDFESCAKEIKI